MFVWMMVVLKIPIVALLWLVWYAIQEPEPVVDDESDSGGSDRRHARPHRPGPPRRGGPHASPPPAPPRVRTHARARRTSRP
jgi:hypothetical protein